MDFQGKSDPVAKYVFSNAAQLPNDEAMSPNPRPTCKVCRRADDESEQYLVRIDGPRMTAVHRSLCFPPARSTERKPVQRAA